MLSADRDARYLTQALTYFERPFTTMRISPADQSFLTMPRPFFATAAELYGTAVVMTGVAHASASGMLDERQRARLRTLVDGLKRGE